MLTPSKTAFFILGMHRSGTSAMAQVCRLLGVSLGDHLSAGLDDNQKGFFEDIRIVEQHEALLKNLGMSWDYPGLFRADWLQQTVAIEAQVELGKLIQSTADSQTHWGLKDPRLTRLLPLWQPLLNQLKTQPKHIIMLRNPLEVAASLQKRNEFSLQDSAWLWLIYMLEAERHSRGQDRVFVRYQDLLQQTETCVTHISACLQCAWTIPYQQVKTEIEHFLEPSLQHHHIDMETNLQHPDLPDLVKQVYQYLEHIATQPDADIDITLFDQAYEHYAQQATDIALKHKQRQSIAWAQTIDQQHTEKLTLSDWASDLKKDILNLETEKHRVEQKYLGLETEKHRVEQKYLAKRKALLETTDWATGLKQQLAQTQTDKKAVEQLYEQSCADKKTVEQRYKDKHEELMVLSDWSQAMNQRLFKIDHSVVMLFAKYAMSAEYLGRHALNKLLAAPLFDKLRYRQQYKQNQANFADVIKSITDQQGRVVIVFPIITWDFRWQRPQHIVSRMSQQGYAIIYLAMGLFAKGKRYDNVHQAGADVGFNTLADHVHQIWLYSKDKLNIYTDALAAGSDDLANLVLGLSALLASKQIKDIYYLVQFPGWSPLAQALQQQFGGKLIFDCMDDHAGFSTNTDAALQMETDLMRQADLLITSSQVLEDKALALNPRTIQVKNGTEFKHFQQPQANGELDHLLDKPIIGYYGAISDWFDLDMLAHAAEQRPDWHFVLVGHTFGCDITQLEKRDNIHFLGEKSYDILPGYLAYFDVCTIPFKIMPLTLATNPVKFYEYLSSGKPVVSVELPELLPYAQDCYLAKDTHQFVSQLERALQQKDDPILIKRRIELAKANDWDQRVDTILKDEVFS